MGTIFKRINSDGTVKYRARIRRKGFPLIEGLFDDPETAKKWLLQNENALLMERNYRKTAHISKGKDLFSDVVKKYINEKLDNKKDGAHRITQLNFWESQFGELTLDEITSEKIKDVLNDLSKKISTKTKKPLAPQTLKRYLAALSHFFTICIVEWNLVKIHPVQALGLDLGATQKRIGSYNYVSSKAKWISVEDRLPEEDTHVLTCNSDLGWVEVGSYSPYNEPDDPDEPTGWESSAALLFEYDVTHWMELPELPTEDCVDQ